MGNYQFGVDDVMNLECNLTMIDNVISNNGTLNLQLIVEQVNVTLVSGNWSNYTDNYNLTLFRTGLETPLVTLTAAFLNATGTITSG